MNFQEKTEVNQVINAIRTLENGNHSRAFIADGIIDVFVDESGIDLGSSTNQLYNTSGRFYSPTGTSESTGNIYSDDFDSIATWNDVDEGGESSQATFDGRSTLKLLTGTSGGEHAIRTKDIGSVDYSQDVVIDIEVYFDDISTHASGKYLMIHVMGNLNKGLSAQFMTDGIYMSDGYNMAKVVDGQVLNNEWAIFRFHYKASNGKWDVYKNEVLIGTDINRTATAFLGNGYVDLKLRAQDGGGTAATAYIDKFTVSDGVPVEATINDLVLNSISTTLDEVPSSARVVLIVSDDVINYNVDLKAFLSRSGIDENQVILTKVGNFDDNKVILTGIRDLSTSEVGYDLSWTVKTFNEIDMKIYATAILYY